ncbi:MAG: DUF1194 domain-containing protein [Roseovarius sp.]
MKRAIAAWICATLMVVTPALAQQSCRQALALGLDVSGSVDAREYRLQLDGVALALSDASVQEALLAWPDAPVRLMVFEWSGMRDQRVVIDWIPLDSEERLADVAKRLRATVKTGAADPATSIASAMLYGAQALAQHSDCWFKTLDISGDGPANRGVHPREVTDAQLGDIVINGLIIGPNGRANTTKNLLNVKTLQDYYQTFVLRGAGAFAETAEDYPDFADAMRRKLLREIQSPVVSGLSDARPRLQ